MERRFADWRRAVRLTTIAMVCLTSAAAAARAQGTSFESRVGPFAIDVRGAMAALGPTADQAAQVGYGKDDLPSKGWGIDVGAHVFPLKLGVATIGVGGNVVMARGHSKPVSTTGEPSGREAWTRFRTYASQLSFNFGNGESWSYLSGGIGYSTFSVSNASYPDPASLPMRQTINYGWGGRWFVRRHVAFSLDLRFYQIAAVSASADHRADPKTKRFVIGFGASFR
jgi:hypothetical protein